VRVVATAPLRRFLTNIPTDPPSNLEIADYADANPWEAALAAAYVALVAADA
jgi:hypothetical protein